MHFHGHAYLIAARRTDDDVLEISAELAEEGRRWAGAFSSSSTTTPTSPRQSLVAGLLRTVDSAIGIRSSSLPWTSDFLATTTTRAFAGSGASFHRNWAMFLSAKAWTKRTRIDVVMMNLSNMRPKLRSESRDFAMNVCLPTVSQAASTQSHVTRSIVQRAEQKLKHHAELTDWK